MPPGLKLMSRTVHRRQYRPSKKELKEMSRVQLKQVSSGTAIRVAYLRGLSRQEIANITGLTKQQVKGVLSDGRIGTAE